jgi:hypothetical protein
VAPGKGAGKEGKKEERGRKAALFFYMSSKEDTATGRTGAIRLPTVPECPRDPPDGSCYIPATREPWISSMTMGVDPAKELVLRVQLHP